MDERPVWEADPARLADPDGAYRAGRADAAAARAAAARLGAGDPPVPSADPDLPGAAAWLAGFRDEIGG